MFIISYSIPIPETLVYLEKLLENNKMNSHKIKEYILLSKLCMNQNLFQIQNKIYQQNEGTAMGNSLSAFLGNLFMSNFEIEFKTQNLYFPGIWLRYVDDIFFVLYFPESNSQLKKKLTLSYSS